MKIYFQIIKTTFSEIATYRVNFLMWRLRMVFSILIIYFFYFALFGQKNFLGYTKEQITTYVLGISLIRAFVISSRSIDIGSIIADGNLANYLLKPFGFFKYWFTRDLADKIVNVLCSLFELVILYLLLKPQLFFQHNLLLIALLLVAILLSIILYFFINISLGLIAFWTPQSWAGVWAPRFLFFMIMEFFSGTLFPLDFLPKNIFFFFSLTPFPYLVYFPLKVYLGNASFNQIGFGFFICSLWCFFAFFIVRKIWFSGLKIFAAEGR